jgi:hypothetical protein
VSGGIGKGLASGGFSLLVLIFAIMVDIVAVLIESPRDMSQDICAMLEGMAKNTPRAKTNGPGNSIRLSCVERDTQGCLPRMLLNIMVVEMYAANRVVGPERPVS